MPDNFAQGEQESYQTAGPQITQETLGARFGIKVSQPGLGVHEPLREPYLVQSVHNRRGSWERTVPGIVQTPLGGLAPGDPTMPPPQIHGDVGAMPCSDDGQFGSGVIDGYPEGPPVPVR